MREFTCITYYTVSMSMGMSMSMFFSFLVPGEKCEHHTVVSQPLTLIGMTKGRKTPASSGEKVMMKHPKPVFTKVSAQVRYHFCYDALQMS